MIAVILRLHAFKLKSFSSTSPSDLVSQKKASGCPLLQWSWVLGINSGLEADMVGKELVDQMEIDDEAKI